MHLLVAHSHPNAVSGAELAIADFVDQASTSLKVTMLAPGAGRLSDFYQEKGYRVWSQRFETKRRLYPGLHLIHSLFLARGLRNRGVDAVLCNTFAAASRVGTGSRLAHIPYAIYVREHIRDIPLHRNILSRANRIIAVSRDIQHHISSMVDPEQISLCYDPIHAQPIQERIARHRARGKRLLPSKTEGPSIGLVGRITPFKQAHLFIQAIPEVLKAIPEAHFIIAGTASSTEKDYEAGVKRLAIELGVDHRVMFLGARPDAIELISEMTVMCVTSSREPLGRVILEAQVIGCPVIAPNTGGPAELVQDGHTGLLFASTAPDASSLLARQLIRLLQDDNLQLELADQAQDLVHKTLASSQPVRFLENELTRLSQMPSRVSHGKQP
jgi:glycosyltransferase involved in cell wall biosynthesis